MKKNRSKAFNRHHRKRVINRRFRIFIEFWGNELEYSKPKGYYHKGKVHCSCPSCSPKRKQWGVPFKEQEKINNMKKEIKDYFNDNY